MSLGGRIFFAYLFIFVICFYYPVDWLARDLRTRYVEGVEDPLVDQANILAALVEADMEIGIFSAERCYRVFEEAYGRALSADIYSLAKRRVDICVYITDASGRVIFDSEDKSNIGADYSSWRDVALTLRGKYGARTTHRDASTAVLYVAAPIIVNGETVGVLTVGKPTTNVNQFMKTAVPRILRIGGISLAAAVLMSLIVSYWISRPIGKLTKYADDVRDGKPTELPKLGKHELSEMALAFEKMREALEGKKYVERYVQTLTHELKSPLSAIVGAAELLDEEMPAEARARFLSNIRTEADRLREIVDRMLELSALENRKMLGNVEPIQFAALLESVLESKETFLSRKSLRVSVNAPASIAVQGDPFLIRQAVSNLIQNAVDFSPLHGRIEVCACLSGRELILLVDDEGPGVADYAIKKAFDRFFSLQRPDTGKKSTGLGLNFVKQVAHLHKGDVSIENRSPQGLRAKLTLGLEPASPSETAQG